MRYCSLRDRSWQCAVAVGAFTISILAHKTVSCILAALHVHLAFVVLDYRIYYDVTARGFVGFDVYVAWLLLEGLVFVARLSGELTLLDDEAGLLPIC